MNDMINYLTTKNRLLVAMLAFILPFSFAKAEVKESGGTNFHRSALMDFMSLQPFVAL